MLRTVAARAWLPVVVVVTLVCGLALFARQAPPTPQPILAAGASHSLAIDASGSLWGWGANIGGQVGDGSNTTRTAPVQLTTAAGTFTTVAAGGSHSLARRSDGAVFAWGLNGSGELGIGSTSMRATPVQVPALTNIVMVAAGAQHSLALRSNGTVAAFGANNEGQLGDGSTTRRTSPVTVSGLTNVVAIAAGGQHSLALKADGTVWAWGANGSSQIGDNSTTRRRTPVRVTTLAAAKAIAAGGLHSVAVTQLGTVFAWGGNASGAVGDGSTTTRRVPVLVPGLASIATVSAGTAHTTAVSTTGAHWAWGTNLGALGDGTTGQRLAPVPITPPTGATLVVAGGAHSLAMTTDGSVWSTGVNLLGPLGSGGNASSTVYGPISGPSQAWGVMAPLLTPTGGTFTLPTSVTATTPTPGAVIHYTTNGADPTTADPSVASDGLIAVDQITLLKVKAFRTGMTASPVTTGTYTLQVATPAIAPGTGTYAAPQDVTIATATPGAALHYTLDGTDPTAASPLYTAPIPVASSAVLRVRGVRANWVDSAVVSATYSFNFGTLNTPVATPGGGTYQTPQTVVLTADPGAAIHYTVDGSDPTLASALYAAPLTIGATTTLNARAFRTDYTPSGLLTASYVIDTTGGGGDPIPPDPATVAPALSQAELTPFADQVSFLYSGANPIQRNATVSALQPYRLAVLRGRVLTRDGQPLSGARVSVHGQPEFGHTVSRLDGMFDLAVNGGGALTLDYTRNGYLPAQRSLSTTWGEYAWADDVRLVALDPNVVVADFSVTAPAQVIRGAAQTDAAGTRQATLIVPAGGVMAAMTLADGTVFPNLAQLSLRATEYTVGPGGPAAMPGSLPPFSAYTYAVELSADEAIAAKATSLTFDPPLPFYVDNFLNLPVGIAVPAGAYDFTASSWVPSANGRVVRVLGTDAGGRATLDVDGSGQAADAPTLAALGVTDGERQRLAETYSAGTSVWRTPIPHFSPWDLNMALRGLPGGDNIPPQRFEPDVYAELDDPVCQQGSIIECQNQTLGEVVPIAGTPFSLTYNSSRGEGRVAKRSLSFTVTGSEAPSTTEPVLVRVAIAGRLFEQEYPNTPNRKGTFTWDGRDAYGRPVMGGAGVLVAVAYPYTVEYAASTQNPAFGLPGGGATGVTALTPLYRRTIGTAMLQGIQPPEAGIAGWSLNVQHTYDPVSATLYMGDGSQRQALAKGAVIDRYAPAVGTAFGASRVAADGSVWALDGGGLRRIDLSGTIDTLSTTPPAGSTVDLALGPNAEAYYAAGTMSGEFNFPELLVGRYGAGAHQLVAAIPLGFGTACGFAFTEAGPVVAVASDHTVYAAVGPCIYRVLPSGAHVLLRQFPAGQMISGLAVGPDGSLHFVRRGFAGQLSYTSQVFRITATGVDELVAGDGSETPTADGAPATTTRIAALRIAIDAQGQLFFSDSDYDILGHRIRRVGDDGLLSTVAGGPYPVRDGWPALASGIDNPYYALTVGPDGAIHTGEHRIAPQDPLGDGTAFQVASSDGAEVFEFTLTGRHLRTRDALTGVALYEFGYVAGRLATIRDREGLVTTILRTGAVPTAIQSPFGPTTTLTLHPTTGLLTGLQDPEGQAYVFGYTQGLLTQMTDPNGQLYQFSHSPLGHLERDEDPEGGVQTLSRATTGRTWTVTRTQSEIGSTTYRTERPVTGGSRVVVTGPDGTQSVRVTADDGRTERRTPDGTISTTIVQPDPRFGMMAPVAEQATVRMPSGLTQTLLQSRSVSLLDPQDLLSVESSTETTTINGRTYASTYDRASGTITSVSPEGRQTVTTLDALGRPVSVQVGDLTSTTLQYDPQGRLDRRVQGTRTTTFGYDSRGYLDTVTDPLTRTVSFTNDAIGRALTQTFPDNRTASFRYDGNSNLRGLTPPGRPEHQFSYSGVNLLEDYTPPTANGAGPTGYNYDTARRPTTVTRADGQSLTFGYEPGTGRLQSLTTPSGLTSYAYEPVTGRLAGVSAPGASLSYGYDGALLLHETWSGGATGAVAWTYDNDFRVITERVRGGSLANFGYDNDGLLMSAGATTYARYPATGLLQTSSVGSVATSFGYNGFGELTSHATTIGGTAVYSAVLGRDAGGRIDQQAEVLGGVPTTDVYGYDPAGRLWTVTRNGVLAVTYGYDANGNRNAVTTAGGTTSATFDAQDRIETFGTRTYTHTPHGDVQSWTDSATSTTTTLTYDVQGNLTQVQQPGTTITYTVDGRNRRIGTAVNGTPVQGFLWQGQLRPVAELDGSGNLVSRFVYGTRINVPEYLVRGGTTYRIVTDHLGSVRLVVDTTTSTVVQALTYDPWGVVLQDTNPGFQPFGYAGGLYDHRTGLVRFGVRDYDATIGRWLAKDPIGFRAADSNLYRYSSNDSINMMDPTGLLTIPGLGWIAAGEESGEAALAYWAARIDNTELSTAERGAAWVGAFFSALWTPCTSDSTLSTLAAAQGTGAYLGRPFWQYSTAGQASQSKWLTRGWGWRAPYQPGQHAIEKLALPPWNQATAVRAVTPSPFTYVGGPRVVGANYGQAGGGWEYAIGGFR